MPATDGEIAKLHHKHLCARDIDLKLLGKS